jgi:hypothetical protein
MDVRPSAEGIGHQTASRSEVVLVDDEQRGTELPGQLRYADARNPHLAVIATCHIARPDI